MTVYEQAQTAEINQQCAIGQGATMVSACWGVFVWREFAQAPRSARILLVFMFFFFLLGLCSVALAPLF